MSKTNQDQESGVEEVNDPAMFESQNPPDRKQKPRPNWLAPVVSAGVVAVLAAAGLAGWKVYESRQHESALADCAQSVETMQSSVKSAQATLNRYRKTAGIRKDQVKDPKTVDDMQQSLSSAEDIEPQAVLCKASMPAGDLQAMAGKAKRSDDVYHSLDRAGKAVLASRDAKSLEDAKTALNAKKDEASKLLSDSDGRVADNAVRDSLQQAISQAGSIKDNKTETYQDAAAALQSAIDQVNTSIQQKNQAAPPAQAAAPAARQPARRSTPAQQRPAPLLVGDGKATCPPAGPHTTMAAAPRQQPPQHPRLQLLRQQHRKAAAQTGETD
ncbi:hypothetical protein J3T92_07190 [Bifidobacterium sp. B4081]|uniref:hypothetical protein n=1 Tax=unclassified Bifidobacterium TaxID=2608897 RepID=UPI00226A5110|nr:MULTISPECIES: hypothetical protein [unclassified Bifidobacterium]MCX8644499.1 hypothetical protein [Bifidobacterium sp. B4077]MCX8646387.1 hypothetical protein [Bifidobacterium sp. B4081]MCX8668190.1 hypothetical protein [Bifidobacterium sp. B3998]